MTTKPIDQETAARAVKANQALRTALVRAKAAEVLASSKLKPGALDAALKDALELLDADDSGAIVPRKDAAKIVTIEQLEHHLRHAAPFLFLDGANAAPTKPGKTVAWNDSKAISDNLEGLAGGSVGVRA